jgi:hypothetical protein
MWVAMVIAIAGIALAVVARMEEATFGS